MNDVVQWGITAIVGILGILAGRYWERHDRRIKKDIEVINQINEILSSNGMIEYMRHQDFADTFSTGVFRVMRDFISYCEKPDSYFLDRKLESHRKDLFNKTDQFLTRLAAESYPLPTTIEANKIPNPVEFDKPDDYCKLDLELNNLADEMIEAHDILFKKARSRL